MEALPSVRFDFGSISDPHCSSGTVHLMGGASSSVLNCSSKITNSGLAPRRLENDEATLALARHGVHGLQHGFLHLRLCAFTGSRWSPSGICRTKAGEPTCIRFFLEDELAHPSTSMAENSKSGPGSEESSWGARATQEKTVNVFVLRGGRRVAHDGSSFSVASWPDALTVPACRVAGEATTSKPVPTTAKPEQASTSSKASYCPTKNVPDRGCRTPARRFVLPG